MLTNLITNLASSAKTIFHVEFVSFLFLAAAGKETSSTPLNLRMLSQHACQACPKESNAAARGGFWSKRLPAVNVWEDCSIVSILLVLYL